MGMGMNTIYTDDFDYCFVSVCRICESGIEYTKNQPRVREAKNLGVYIDERLLWEEHVAKLCGNICGSIRRLWQMTWALPLESRYA